MAEISINTIIKIVLVLLVIIVLLVSFFILWRNYIRPNFMGIGKEVAGTAFFYLKDLKRKF